MVDPTKLSENQLLEFAGGWKAKVSEPIRKDIVFVEVVADILYRHHAFGIDHPVWDSARVVEKDEV